MTDAQRLLEDSRAICLFAALDEQCAGQCIVRLGGNALCDLIDLRVDSRFRRQGVATELIRACCEWTRRQNRAGIRVETTDEQPVACQFFESCGFELGGVDRLRRFADPSQRSRVPAMRESILTFYKFLT